MAFNIPNGAFRLSAEEAGGGPDYAKALSQGFQTAADVYKPQTMAEELLKKQILNKFLPRSEEARIANTEASTTNMQDTHGMAGLRRQLLGHQINQIKNPKLTGTPALLEYLLANKDRLNGIGGNASNQAEEQESSPAFGEDQPSAIPSVMPKQQQKSTGYADALIQQAMDKISGKKTYAPSNTSKELQEQADAEAGFYPGSSRSKRFESPDIQKEYVDALNVKTTGLKKGSHYVLGENGERIGEQRPLSAKERDIEKGSSLFKDFFPLVNKGLNRYSGENSIRNMENDAKNYKSDPAARERFDQLLLASKLATLTTVNEAARFGAGKQNQVFNRFNQSLSSFDVPKKLDSLIKQYQIPAKANIKAGLKFANTLDKAEENYKRNASPNKIEYYPGKAPAEKSNFTEQQINDEAKHFGTTPKIIKDAIKAGVETEEELIDWIKGVQK